MRDVLENALSSAAVVCKLNFTDPEWQRFCKHATRALDEQLRRSKFTVAEKIDFSDCGTIQQRQAKLLELILEELRKLNARE
ncbi:MAG: hypothetical protein SGI88_02110 [Candidatus Hydrogenedentes bacterium]|nr:hypothetical protein [Candidatus Hydrogenedentota bacterium]